MDWLGVRWDEVEFKGNMGYTHRSPALPSSINHSFSLGLCSVGHSWRPTPWNLHVDRASTDTVGEAADCLCLRWGNHQGPAGQVGDWTGHSGPRKMMPRIFSHVIPLSFMHSRAKAGNGNSVEMQDQLWVSPSTMRQ